MKDHKCNCNCNNNKSNNLFDLSTFSLNVLCSCKADIKTEKGNNISIDASHQNETLKIDEES